jgi:hypothetical protein
MEMTKPIVTFHNLANTPKTMGQLYHLNTNKRQTLPTQHKLNIQHPYPKDTKVHKTHTKKDGLIAPAPNHLTLCRP